MLMVSDDGSEEELEEKKTAKKKPLGFVCCYTAMKGRVKTNETGEAPIPKRGGACEGPPHIQGVF
jgi:hypothetical protein